MNMDIIERLRAACGYQNIDADVRSFQSSATNGLVLDAADEVERLRAALEKISKSTAGSAVPIARAALKG